MTNYHLKTKSIWEQYVNRKSVETPRMYLTREDKATTLRNSPILDTGSNVNIVGRPWLERTFKKKDWVMTPKPHITTYLGNGATLESSATTTFKVRDKNHKSTSMATCNVVEDDYPPILSNSFLIDNECIIDVRAPVMATNHGYYDLSTGQHGLLQLQDIWTNTVKNNMESPAQAPTSFAKPHPFPAL